MLSEPLASPTEQALRRLAGTIISIMIAYNIIQCNNT